MNTEIDKRTISLCQEMYINYCVDNLLKAFNEIGLRNVTITSNVVTTYGADLRVNFGDIFIKRSRIPYMYAEFTILVKVQHLNTHPPTEHLVLNGNKIVFDITFQTVRQGERVSSEEVFFRHPHISRVGPQGQFCGPISKIRDYLTPYHDRNGIVHRRWEKFAHSLYMMVVSYNPSGAYHQIPVTYACAITGSMSTTRNVPVTYFPNHIRTAYVLLEEGGNVGIRDDLFGLCQECWNRVPINSLHNAREVLEHMNESPNKWSDAQYICGYCASEKKYLKCTECEQYLTSVSELQITEVGGVKTRTLICGACSAKYDNCAICGSLFSRMNHLFNGKGATTAICDACAFSEPSPSLSRMIYFDHSYASSFEQTAQTLARKTIYEIERSIRYV